MMLNTTLLLILLLTMSACGQHQSNMPLVVNAPGASTSQNNASPTPLPVTSPTPQTEVSFAGNLRIVPQSVELKNEQWRYKIDAEYPQIEGSNDAAILRFNREVKELVRSKYKWPLGRPSKQSLRYYTKWPGVYNSVNIEYDVLLATDDLLSIYLMAYHYGIGAAHSVHESFTVNYDLKSHSFISLAGVFRPGSKHIPFISRRCIDQLLSKRPMKSTDAYFSDEFARLKNFESWNMTRQGLRFNFDACKVDGCAAGDLSVEIPLAELKPLLNANGPLRSLTP